MPSEPNAGEPLPTTGTVLWSGLWKMVITNSLKQIDKHDPTPASGTQGFGDQPVTVEPDSGVGGPDAEHLDGLRHREYRAEPATSVTIDVGVELHVAHVGTAATFETTPFYYAGFAVPERGFRSISNTPA